MWLMIFFLGGGLYDSMTERSFRSHRVASVPTVLFGFLLLCCFFIFATKIKWKLAEVVVSWFLREIIWD